MKEVPEGIDRNHCEALKNQTAQSNRKCTRERRPVLTKRWKQTGWYPSSLPSPNRYSSVSLVVAPTTLIFFLLNWQPVASLVSFGAFFVNFVLPIYLLHHATLWLWRWRLIEILNSISVPSISPSYPFFIQIIRFILLMYNFDYVTSLFKKTFFLIELFQLINHKGMIEYHHFAILNEIMYLTLLINLKSLDKELKGSLIMKVSGRHPNPVMGFSMTKKRDKVHPDGRMQFNLSRILANKSKLNLTKYLDIITSL